MASYIRDLLDKENKDFEVNLALCKRIEGFRTAFINKNPDHIEFFGGHLTGAHIVRFTSSDRSKWFDEVLLIDAEDLQEKLYNLPTINPEWQVSSDVMNNVGIWVCHKLYQSKELKPEVKLQAMLSVLMILQYRFLTSRLKRHFRYPANREIAEATYSALSGKFALKKAGSWEAMLVGRAEEILSKSSIHLQAIIKMDDDEKVRYCLNDAQGRIRDALKKIYGVFLETHRKGIRVSSTSSIVEHDGVGALKDKSQLITTHVRYVRSIVSDKNSFLKEELLKIVESIMSTMPPRLFRETLSWMSDNYSSGRSQDIASALDETIVHAYNYFFDNATTIKKNADIGHLLTKLRGAYMSSRSVDPDLISLRERMEKIVEIATGNKNKSNVASVRTGVLLYIIARTFTMKHYSGGV